MSSTKVPPSWPLPVPASLPKGLGEIDDSMDYEERLFHYTMATQNDELHFLQFRGLHRLNIFRLQNKLAYLKGKCWQKRRASETDEKDLENTLHAYGQSMAHLIAVSDIFPAMAIRDYALMQSFQSLDKLQAVEREHDLSQAFPEFANMEGSPYSSRYCHLSTSSERLPSDPLRNWLSGKLPRHLTYTKAEINKRLDEYLRGDPPITTSPFVDSLSRFVIAFTGGLSLLVPILIMSLPQSSQAKSLGTVSAAITLFALLLAVGVRASNAETLVATATYAAVLVVFLGTSSSTNTP